ncbi:GntR family transcriptional regulator [Pelagibacterium mangrovi]|uniref:GntR family transcriptional regulator n=1 Tax=Pelagibacterium mangrovi TaxID=3119828 RepID=UPI002FC78237
MEEAKPKPGRGKLQDQVLARLRYGIMSGLFVPGQIMSLRKLAERLGTSPMPVRESLSRLVAANALEELPNRSVRVPILTAESLTELFEVRCMIEGMATRLAATNVTQELIGDLQLINDAVKAAHERGQMAEVLSANQEFHFKLYRHAGSHILLPIIESLWLRCGPTMYFSLNAPSLWDTAAHIDIIAALQRNDSSRAQAAMIDDIMKTGRYLVEQAKSGVTSGPFADLRRPEY